MINKNNFFVFAVTLMSLTLVFINMPLLLLIALRSNDNLPGYIFPEEHFDFFIVLVGIFTAVLIGLYVVAVRKFGEYVETEYEAKRAVENLKQIKQLVDSSRKQRHDFYHQLQTVYGLLEGGFFDRAIVRYCLRQQGRPNRPGNQRKHLQAGFHSRRNFGNPVLEGQPRQRRATQWSGLDRYARPTEPGQPELRPSFGAVGRASS